MRGWRFKWLKKIKRWKNSCFPFRQPNQQNLHTLRQWGWFFCQNIYKWGSEKGDNRGKVELSQKVEEVRQKEKERKKEERESARKNQVGLIIKHHRKRKGGGCEKLIGGLVGIGGKLYRMGKQIKRKCEEVHTGQRVRGGSRG